MSSNQNTWSPDLQQAVHVAPTQPPASTDTASAAAQIRTTPHAAQGPVDSQQATYAGPQSPAAGATVHGAQVLGNYRIEQEVAAGACGVLYRAVDQRLNRTVAIKVLHGDHAESQIARQRIGQEAMAAAAVGHESIVTVFDVSVDAGQPPFLVMEFVEGKTLREHMQPGVPMQAETAARYAMQIAEGLGAAHEKNLIHRDIKPSNVLIEDRSDRAKITDFGLARGATDDMRLTSDNIIAGTPAYMSPEQVTTPGEVGPPTDIYSTGVVLYELLTGALPFDGAVREILTRVLHEEPRPIREINPQAPTALEAICMKAMAKDPQQRYASGACLAEDLKRWLNGQAVSVSPTEQRKSATWRPRAAMIYSALAIAAVGVSLALFNFEVHTLIAELTPFAIAGNGQGVVTQVDTGATPPVEASHETIPAETTASSGQGNAVELDVLATKNSHRLEHVALDEFDEELDRAIENSIRNNLAATQRYAGKAWKIAAQELQSKKDDPIWYENGLDALVILVDCARMEENKPQAVAFAKEHLRLAYQLNRLEPTQTSNNELTESLAICGATALEAGDLKSAFGFLSTAATRFRQSAPKGLPAKQAFVETCHGMALVYWRSSKAVEAVQWAAQAEKAINKLEEDPTLQIDPGFAEWAASMREDVEPMLAHNRNQATTRRSVERIPDVSIFTGDADASHEDDRYAPESFDPRPPPPHPPHGHQFGPHLPPPPPFHHRPR